MDIGHQSIELWLKFQTFNFLIIFDLLSNVLE